jgi:hypothetical protein
MLYRLIRFLGSVAVLGLIGCSSPSFMRDAGADEPLLTDAPAGKALVNFHRPGNYAAGIPFEIWDRTDLIGSVSGQTLFQFVCDPGDHVFLGSREPYTAIHADLRMGGVYDVVVNSTPGWIGAKITMEALSPGHPRHIELAAWEQQEVRQVFIDDQAARKRNEKRGKWAAQTLEEFMSGSRGVALQSLGPGDAR